VEQDRAPAVLPDHHELAGPTVDQPPGRGGHHRRDPHPHRAAGACRTRHRRLPPRDRRDPRAAAVAADPGARPARAVELHHRPHRRPGRAHRRPRARPRAGRGPAPAGRAAADRHEPRRVGHAGPGRWPPPSRRKPPSAASNNAVDNAAGHPARAARACCRPPTASWSPSSTCARSAPRTSCRTCWGSTRTPSARRSRRLASYSTTTITRSRRPRCGSPPRAH
jgi:hypothetical protein